MQFDLLEEDTLAINKFLQAACQEVYQKQSDRLKNKLREVNIKELALGDRERIDLAKTS